MEKNEGRARQQKSPRGVLFTSPQHAAARPFSLLSFYISLKIQSDEMEQSPKACTFLLVCFLIEKLRGDRKIENCKRRKKKTQKKGCARRGGVSPILSLAAAHTRGCGGGGLSRFSSSGISKPDQQARVAASDFPPPTAALAAGGRSSSGGRGLAQLLREGRRHRHARHRRRRRRERGRDGAARRGRGGGRVGRRGVGDGAVVGPRAAAPAARSCRRRLRSCSVVGLLLLLGRRDAATRSAGPQPPLPVGDRPPEGGGRQRRGSRRRLCFLPFLLVTDNSSNGDGGLG